MASRFSIQQPQSLPVRTSGPVSMGLGFQYKQAEEQRKQQEVAQLAQQQRQAEMQADYSQVMESRDPRMMADFVFKYPEAQKRFEQSYGFTSPQTDEIASSGYARAIAAETPEQAASILEQTANKITQAGGQPTTTLADAQGLRSGQMSLQDVQLGVAATRPDVWKAYEQVVRGVGSTGKVTPTANMQDWQEYKRLKNTSPEDAKAFGQKVGFVKPDGTELSVHLQKRLSNATDNAIKFESDANRIEGLAGEFDQADVGGGLFQGSWGERWKDITGQQDAVTSLRKEYAAIRGSQVVNNLPPGAASDKDIEMALAGFPTDNATGEQIASFLRGVAKLNREKARFENFKAGYISEKGNEKGMVKAYKEQLADVDDYMESGAKTAEQQYPEGTVIRNPNTGETMIMKGGEWVANG